MQAIADGAPRLMDFLGAESLAHFAAVRAVLDAAGLDYYNLTVFEWITDHLGSQGTVCGGGRYDGLFEQLGGKPTPAIGWGMGVERMLLLLEAVGVAIPAAAPDVYAIVPGPQALAAATVACESLRAAGLSVLMHAAGTEGWGSIKAQFRRADASGARHALVFGDDELARGEVAVKPLRDTAQPQRSVALSELDSWARTLAGC